jgi:hypothetical protein
MSRRYDDVTPILGTAGAPMRKSGRAVFDEHGRTTWEWQVATGVFERHITDAQLQALQAPELQLLEASPANAGVCIYSAPPTVKARKPAASEAVKRAGLWGRLRWA